MVETLQLHPSHLVPCNIPRSAPSHSLRVYNNDVSRKDLKTLEGQAWLNDKIIHAYLRILMREMNDVQPTQLFVLPSFLVSKWMKSDYSSWKFSKVDLLSFKHILLPVCVSSHWILIHISTRNRVIYIYDSLSKGQSYSEYQDHWIQFLQERGDTHELLGWSLEIALSSRQSDGYNCGIFVLMNAEAIVNGLPAIIMRTVHCVEYRHYVRRRLIHTGKKNDTIICEQPFCTEPSRKSSAISQCDHCYRWVHKICAGQTCRNKRYICVMCID